YSIQGRNARIVQAAAGVGDQVGHQAVEHALQRLIELQFVRGIGIGALGVAIKELEHRHAGANLLQGEDVRLEAVVEVGRVVGDLVGQVNELGFERRALV